MSAVRRGPDRKVRGRLSTTPALTLAGLSVLAFAGIEVVLVLGVPPEVEARTGPRWASVAYVLLGVEYLLVGLLTWARRPTNRTGALLCFCALAVMLSGLSNTSDPILVGIGAILAQGPIAVLVQLVLAFPSGVLTDRWTRTLCVGGYLVTIVLPAPAFLFGETGTVPGWIHVAALPTVVEVFGVVQRVAAVVVLCSAGVVWFVRLRKARRDQLPVLASVSGYGMLTLAFLDLSANLAWALGVGPLPLFVAQVSAFAGLPLVLAIAIARGGFARAGGVETLVAWLGTEDDRRAPLTEALAEALGDPSVELLFWLPDTRSYVDADGAPAAPRTGPGRGTMEVELAGRQVGLVGFDTDLIADAEHARAAGQVLALAIDRERLIAELLAGQTALRHSLTRIVEAGDLERRRIARDLHDGLQSQLIVLAVRAGRLAAESDGHAIAVDARAVRSSAESAIATLREVVHGIIPALLVGRGLYAATEELVDQLALPATLDLPVVQGRLASAVETAGYFTVAEAVTNAVKHARASRLQIRLHASGGQLSIEIRDDGVGGADLAYGGGLRGIADRVEALGGQLHIQSPPGHGTCLTAEVPCES